ncbi:unnamed protein product, partial [Adineta ricciae]
TCFVCQKTDGSSSKVLSTEQQKSAFIKRGIVIPAGSRFCRDHLYGKHLTFEALHQIVPTKTEPVVFDAKGVMELITECCTMVQDTKTFDFDDPTSLNDDAYYNLTGLEKDQFDNLLSTLTSMRNSYVRSIRVGLALFLVKMRLGVSNRVLSFLFHMKNKRVVSRIVHAIAEGLLKNFVPKHLGFQHIDRRTVLNCHQTLIASQLMADRDDQVILVMDGAYLFIQKSSSNQFQRRSFSMHKHRNLIKPMITTATDGYILSVQGPYLADGRNNDASVAKNIFIHNEEDVLNWLNKDDVIVVDRGFRDPVKTIYRFGFNVQMPDFLKGKKQLSSAEANHSRCVAKVRWIIESGSLNSNLINVASDFSQILSNPNPNPTLELDLNLIGVGFGAYLVLASIVGSSGHITAIDSADLSYGSPYTLGEAQKHLKNSSLGAQIMFIQTDVHQLLLDDPTLT